MHMLKVEYLLKISPMSEVHMPTSGPHFPTSTQPQARRVVSVDDAKLAGSPVH
jgi:hypothetical protein